MISKEEKKIPDCVKQGFSNFSMQENQLPGGLVKTQNVGPHSQSFWFKNLYV